MMPLMGLFPLVLFVLAGESPPSSPPATSQPATSQPAPAHKPRLAVLDFRVSGKVDASGSSVAAALVRKEFNASDRYDLMDRALMRERMAEKDWAASTECDTVKCLVKYGTSLDVEKIVGGTISSFGDKWFVEIRLVDVNTGREERTFAREHLGRMEDVLGVVVDGARDLLGTTANQSADARKSDQHDEVGKLLRLDCGNDVKLELVLIPAGKFKMGANDGADDQKPPHEVVISKPFYMGRFEVTQAQWEAVMGENPSSVKGNLSLPVDMVSWDDCQEFCKRLAAKTGLAVELPTEAEWEYACRAGSTGRYCFGNSDSELVDYAWYLDNSGSQIHPVGAKKANTWGLYDMHGNVSEWCADWYNKYPGSSAKSDEFGKKFRIMRDGCCLSFAWGCRSAFRCKSSPPYRIIHGGLRISVGTR